MLCIIWAALHSFGLLVARLLSVAHVGASAAGVGASAARVCPLAVGVGRQWLALVVIGPLHVLSAPSICRQPPVRVAQWLSIFSVRPSLPSSLGAAK